MTGASMDHDAIVMDTRSERPAQMKGRPCRVHSNAMKIASRPANAGTYPDLVAFCGEPELPDDRRGILLNPSLMVEVLSDSTEARDRGPEFAL